VLDASLLQVYEARYRPPEHHVKSWTDVQQGKVARGLAAFERGVSAPGEAIDVGDITLACALGYLDLRFAGAWREEHPRLVAWLDHFAGAVPSFEATRVAA
jgi:glutathione S-transferase